MIYYTSSPTTDSDSLIHLAKNQVLYYGNCMTFDEYQAAAMKTDSFKITVRDMSNDGFINKVLGICGETGEFADKIKKIRRDRDGVVSDQDVDELKKELGDILWYLATTAKYLDLSLDDIAKTNIEKLADRAKRNKIKGAGDNR